MTGSESSMCKGPVVGDTEEDCMAGAQRARLRPDREAGARTYKVLLDTGRILFFILMVFRKRGVT